MENTVLLEMEDTVLLEMEDTVLLETKKFTYESCSTKLSEIHPFSITQILTTYYIILIPCLLVFFSLDVLHTLWCMLVCRNLVELNFVLKPKFGVNP